MRSGSAASASRSRTGVTDYPRGNRSRPTLPNNVRCWEQSGKHLLAVRISHIDLQRTSSWLWPALASALVANDWTVELTGLITSRGQRKLAPAGARSGAALGPRRPHKFDSRQLAFFTILHL